MGHFAQYPPVVRAHLRLGRDDRKLWLRSVSLGSFCHCHLVMAGLVPAIHVFFGGQAVRKTWMPGIKPGMTTETLLFPRSRILASFCQFGFVLPLPPRHGRACHASRVYPTCEI
jgi:hypothetical protein